MAQRQETEHTRDSHDVAGGMMSMAILMVAMCAGMVVAISIASAVGGPIAWALALLVVVALTFAHMKFMNHGGH